MTRLLERKYLDFIQYVTLVEHLRAIKNYAGQYEFACRLLLMFLQPEELMINDCL